MMHTERLLLLLLLLLQLLHHLLQRYLCTRTDGDSGFPLRRVTVWVSSGAWAMARMGLRRSDFGLGQSSEIRNQQWF